ncbi:MAG TPA: nicotinate-nucleotide--dimethylbenzimidazole phosphoribosyltransferase [Solirubrobacteraceae bacterium]|nr:nicotinate-nucleotide--dimethylbenzimidazole phosphoribosyltransferase [Solirubrobacteraceae bacterium]
MDPDRSARPLDARAAGAARERQDALLKPRGSLGRLEDLAVWMAGVTGEPTPELRPLVVIAAADHGVAAEGVSAYPQEVTGQMLTSFLSGGSAISVLAREAGTEVLVVDAGVAARADADDAVIATGLGPSRNLAVEPALTRDEVGLALAIGRRLAGEARARGANVLVGGDMGIANTTPSACLAAWLTGRAAPDVCGRGTGVDDDGLERKRAVVERALALHGQDIIDGPLEALRRLGGGELAVLTGLALGAGEHGLGYVCDGVIATAAAAIAVACDPELRPRLIAGHRSPEPAHQLLLDHLGLDPVLDLGMRLGEASGAAAALAILRLACALHAGMATFDEAKVAGPAQ